MQSRPATAPAGSASPASCQLYPARGSGQTCEEFLGDKLEEDGAVPGGAEVFQHGRVGRGADLVPSSQVSLAPGTVWCAEKGDPSEEPWI